jgi:LmeA-like phospholipid-binding
MTSPSGHDPGAGGSGPLLRLLARGLELWLRQQCTAIGELEIRLDGSAAQLLRGRLKAVSLRARGIDYQDLLIDQVQLESEPIQVRMGALLRHQSFELEQPFRVRGEVRLSGDGLNRSLARAPWRWLGNSLAETLLGTGPLSTLTVTDDLLLLQAQQGANPPIEGLARLEAVAGTVEVACLDGGPCLRLPMDRNISIDRAIVAEGGIELSGEARVSP